MFASLVCLNKMGLKGHLVLKQEARHEELPYEWEGSWVNNGKHDGNRHAKL